ncbi:SDR family NAD(P)-dependent oxidoreductase [Aeromicrobium ginsengisoli]|uniref:SDR family oxidoreductase n=1 Tax=Aeromicrobium ginsengisoli TaxID=363867 RepID=A0A5M4FDZ9_9ACTN|nr:SDR family oxidoreductase [Aeromicrobium ginsengisoli]KAA1397430.1 SDR family oxidoreductase [Aeromicrobium ginsengisoli]
MGSDISGRRAVVTGGARGIGAAIARRLADDGVSVAILDLPGDAGPAAAAELGGTFVGVDLADAAAAMAAVDEAADALGGVDILVNNAGILRFASLLDLTVDDWDRTLAINARATVFTMQAAARAMIAQGGGGAIVNIASMAAKTGGLNELGYAASKAAVVSVTRSAAADLGPHQITVNSLCPGYILTEMGAATRTEEDVAAWSAKSPLGRLGAPQDVAGFVRFLVSPDATYLTGQAFNVTGGMITQ